MRTGLVVGGAALMMLSAVPALAELTDVERDPTGAGLSAEQGRIRTVQTRPVPEGRPTSSVRRIFTAEEDKRARELAEAGRASLIERYPPLEGLSVEQIQPVLREESTEPFAVMVTYVLPARLPVIEMDIIRRTSGSADERPTPERVPSEIMNLRALSAIIPFDLGEIVHLLPAPRRDAASEPDEVVRVRPTNPATSQNPVFAG